MRRNLSRKNLIKCVVAGLCGILTGCGTIGLAQEATFESAYENTTKEQVNIYTSESRGVVSAVNEEDKTITVYRMNENDDLTLTYDGTTVVQDKYGSAMTMQLLTPGEIVDLYYNSELQKAGSVIVSADAWNYDNVERHVIDEGRGTLQVGSDTYRIGSDTKIFSDFEQISLSQVLKQDVLSLKGTGYDVESIVVDKGHGYLNLENEEALIGGFIEVGQAAIQQISQDMLIIVPEGNYVVSLSADGIQETREVTIVRNQETILNLDDIEIPQPVNGRVVFSIYPEKADVYVNGVGVDASYPILLPFGLHQVTASADGYDTVSEYINVEGETTVVKLSLDESEVSTVSENSVEENDFYTITVKEPEGVEVYQDNLYMGIAPVTYKKTVGSHTITLRKAGYVTKSYQIEVADENRDLTYSFPDLLEEEENKTKDSKNSVSDNSVSDNSASKKSESDSSVSDNSVSDNTASGNNNKKTDDSSRNLKAISGNKIIADANNKLY